MKRNTPRAFTMVELMVVIAVIGLLVAMMLPSFSQVFRVARQTQCANNLEHIGQAISTLGANAAITPGATKLQPMGWRGQLDNYVAHDTSVVLCPEDPAPHTGLSEQGLGAYALRTYSGSTFLYDMPMAEGPACRKENVSSDGSSYDLSFEDQRDAGGLAGGDLSFANPIMHVQFSGNNVIVSVKGGGGGYRWDLVDPYGNVLIISVMKISMAGVSCTLSGVGTPFSYGLNSVAPYIKPNDDRILVLDYPAELAHLAGVNETMDNWLASPWTDSDGHYTFARHFNRCNVLMANGRVIHLSPQQMDPTNPQLLTQYWKP